MALQTEYEFNLPKGYVDESGSLHRKGTMRLAAAADEILPMKDPRVKTNPAYLSIIVLARVISKLGELKDVSPGVIEKLFIGDLTFLQELYRRVNGDGNVMLNLKCPHCGGAFKESLPNPGE
jgi:PHP family Zn ribbon phosphoesterase